MKPAPMEEIVSMVCAITIVAGLSVMCIALAVAVYWIGRAL